MLGSNSLAFPRVRRELLFSLSVGNLFSADAVFAALRLCPLPRSRSPLPRFVRLSRLSRKCKSIAIFSPHPRCTEWLRKPRAAWAGLRLAIDLSDRAVHPLEPVPSTLRRIVRLFVLVIIFPPFVQGRSVHLIGLILLPVNVQPHVTPYMKQEWE